MSEPFQPVLLARRDMANSQSLKTYQATGGYEGLRKALAMEPKEVIDTVIKSGLRGRGGAGFSTGTKWTFLPKDVQGPIYLCINATKANRAPSTTAS